MIELALILLRKFWPVLAVAGLVGAGWFAYQRHGTVRYEAGKSEVMAQWRETDKIAVAVGNETTALLKRGAAAAEGKLNAKLTDLSTRNAAAAADSRSLRGQLATIASTPASGPAPSPACRDYGPQFRSCAGLLGEGVELATEGAGLAGDLAAKLTGLQEWAGLVR